MRVGETPEAGAPVGAWLHHFAHILSISVWLHLTLDMEWVGNPWLQAGEGKVKFPMFWGEQSYQFSTLWYSFLNYLVI